MNKYQKSRVNPKKEFSSIAALQTHLFSELDSLKETNTPSPQQDPLYNEFEETEPLPIHNNPVSRNVLNKAKHITYSNKGKIERMRKQIRRIEEGEGAQFFTGVGLFEKQTPEYEEGCLDDDSMMRDLASSKMTDLEELRRMIKKTESNLKMYSQSVYKTQNKVVSAADKCGWEIETGLAIKINRCNLDQVYRQSKPKAPSAVGEKSRRKTMTASFPRRKVE